MVALLLKNLLVPCSVCIRVEDDQMAIICLAAIHVGSGLRQAFGDDRLQVAAAQLGFDHHLLRRVGYAIVSADQQVGASPPQAILPSRCYFHLTTGTPAYPAPNVMPNWRNQVR